MNSKHIWYTQQEIMDRSDKCFTDSKMHGIAFTKQESDGKSWVDSYGCAVTDEKVAASKVSGYGCGLFLCESAWAFVGSEGGGGSPCVVVVVLRSIHGRWSKGAWSGRSLSLGTGSAGRIRIWVGTSGPDATFQAALTRKDL